MGLRKFVDKIKPTFSEGGKLSFLHSTFPLCSKHRD